MIMSENNLPTEITPPKFIKPDDNDPTDKFCLDKLVQIADVIGLENLNQNTVIVLKLGGDEGHKIRMHRAFIQFLAGRGDILKKKKITVLFLNDGDGLEILKEEEMNRAGWYKKESSRIITPYSR